MSNKKNKSARVSGPCGQVLKRTILFQTKNYETRIPNQKIGRGLKYHMQCWFYLLNSAVKEPKHFIEGPKAQRSHREIGVHVVLIKVTLK